MNAKRLTADMAIPGLVCKATCAHVCQSRAVMPKKTTVRSVLNSYQNRILQYLIL